MVPGGSVWDDKPIANISKKAAEHCHDPYSLVIILLTLPSMYSPIPQQYFIGAEPAFSQDIACVTFYLMSSKRSVSSERSTINLII